MIKIATKSGSSLVLKYIVNQTPTLEPLVLKKFVFLKGKKKNVIFKQNKLNQKNTFFYNFTSIYFIEFQLFILFMRIITPSIFFKIVLVLTY